MSKELAVRSNQTPVFSVENNLTIADILSVAVSEAEGKLQKVLKEGVAQNKAIEARIKQIGKDVDVQIDLLQAECGLKEDIDNANKYLSKLFDISIRVTADIEKKEKIIRYSYECGHKGNHRKVPFSPEITRLVELFDSEKESLEQVRADVAETRKRLANIPALERRYRGKLVANQLEKTADGKSLLKVITANMEEELRNI